MTAAPPGRPKLPNRLSQGVLHIYLDVPECRNSLDEILLVPVGVGLSVENLTGRGLARRTRAYARQKPRLATVPNRPHASGVGTRRTLSLAAAPRY